MKKHEITKLQYDIEKYKTYYESEKEKREKAERELSQVRDQLSTALSINDREIINFREIIRWQINPETAKYPFRSSKDNRDDEPKNTYGLGGDKIFM